jgi:hypothetical protein
MEGGTELKLALEKKIEQVLEVVITEDGLRKSMETQDVQDKKLSCLHSIDCGLGRNEVPRNRKANP